MIDFPAAPTIGQKFKAAGISYTFDGNGWLGTPGTMTDAPANGRYYARKDVAWAEMNLDALGIPGHDQIDIGTDLVYRPAASGAAGISISTHGGALAVPYITAKKDDKTHWQVNMGDGSHDSLIMYHFDDAGAALAGMVIQGDDKSVGFFGPLSISTHALYAASGMGMMWDGGGFNYLNMGAGNSTPWSWQWNRSTGNLNWLGSASNVLFQIEGNV